jgi:glycosyltransferase involved in cell wall biosynthesis
MTGLAMWPLVSVAIPTINSSETLGATLKSFQGQTYLGIAIIVVGKGSSGIQDAIKDGETGVLVPRDSPEMLEEPAGALVFNPAILAAIGEAAIGWSREFSWDRSATPVLPVVLGRAAAGPAMRMQEVSSAR